MHLILMLIIETGLNEFNNLINLSIISLYLACLFANISDILFKRQYKKQNN